MAAIDVGHGSTFQLGDPSSSDPSTALVYTNYIYPIILDTSDSWIGILFIGDEGTVYGKATLASDLTLSPTQRLTIGTGATLEIPQEVTFRNEGTVHNDGTIVNGGSISGNGIFEGTGSMIGNGLLFPQEVSFDTLGGPSVDPIMVSKGHPIGDAVRDPARTGYRFDGWFADSACTTPWDVASERVEASLTLYAKWTKNAPDQPGKPGNPSIPNTPDDPQGSNSSESSNGTPSSISSNWNTANLKHELKTTRSEEDQAVPLLGDRTIGDLIPLSILVCAAALCLYRLKDFRRRKNQ